MNERKDEKKDKNIDKGQIKAIDRGYIKRQLRVNKGIDREDR